MWSMPHTTTQTRWTDDRERHYDTVTVMVMTDCDVSGQDLRDRFLPTAVPAYCVSRKLSKIRPCLLKFPWNSFKNVISISLIWLKDVNSYQNSFHIRAYTVKVESWRRSKNRIKHFKWNYNFQYKFKKKLKETFNRLTFCDIHLFISCQGKKLPEAAIIISVW